MSEKAQGQKSRVSEKQSSVRTPNLSGVRAILFDFDGPLCDVFAKISPSSIAHRIQDSLGWQPDFDDPLDLLEHLADGDRQILAKVEDEVVASEVEAVNVAPDTSGGRECISACVQAGLEVAIVSNNSASSVSTFLERQGLLNLVSTIVGRAHAEPEKMKPSPWPLRVALEKLAITSAEAMMVGDSVSDIRAARSAGVRMVALANKPGKKELFATFDVPIISDMWELRDVISATGK